MFGLTTTQIIIGTLSAFFIFQCGQTLTAVQNDQKLLAALNTECSALLKELYCVISDDETLGWLIVDANYLRRAISLLEATNRVNRRVFMTSMAFTSRRQLVQAAFDRIHETVRREKRTGESKKACTGDSFPLSVTAHTNKTPLFVTISPSSPGLDRLIRAFRLARGTRGLAGKDREHMLRSGLALESVFSRSEKEQRVLVCEEMCLQIEEAIKLQQMERDGEKSEDDRRVREAESEEEWSLLQQIDDDSMIRRLEAGQRREDDVLFGGQVDANEEGLQRLKKETGWAGEAWEEEDDQWFNGDLYSDGRGTKEADGLAKVREGVKEDEQAGGAEVEEVGLLGELGLLIAAVEAALQKLAN